jgi:hypothetical protein
MSFKNKKLCSIILSFALVLGIFVAPLQDIAFAEETANVKEITIVHTNEIHNSSYK